MLVAHIIALHAAVVVLVGSLEEWEDVDSWVQRLADLYYLSQRPLDNQSVEANTVKPV